MQQALRTKLLIEILAALGVVLTHPLRANNQTAKAISNLGAEPDKAAEIDRDDKVAILKIRERNAQKANTTPKQ